MAVAESIKVDDDGWYLHADLDAVGAKLILRKYTSDTEYTEYGEYRTFPEAASGYIEAKYAESIKASQGATLSSVLTGKKTMLDSFKSGFTGGAIKAARVRIDGG